MIRQLLPISGLVGHLPASGDSVAGTEAWRHAVAIQRKTCRARSSVHLSYVVNLVGGGLLCRPLNLLLHLRNPDPGCSPIPGSGAACDAWCLREMVEGWPLAMVGRRTLRVHVKRMLLALWYSACPNIAEVGMRRDA